MIEDFHSDATTEEIDYDDYENELTINDDDDRTVIFIYEEYARAHGLIIEQEQRRLVDYPDTESEDSYFEVTVKLNPKYQIKQLYAQYVRNY